MTRSRLTAALLLVTFALPQTGCIGSFALTNKVLDWNRGLGSIVVQEIVFLLFCVVPVYGATVFIDAVILNLIEAFTGSNPIALNEPRDIPVAEGVALRVERLGDGELRTTLLQDGAAPVERRYTFAEDGVVVADARGAVVASARVDGYGGLTLSGLDGDVLAEWSPAQVRAAQDALVAGDARALAVAVRPGATVVDAE